MSLFHTSNDEARLNTQHSGVCLIRLDAWMMLITLDTITLDILYEEAFPWICCWDLSMIFSFIPCKSHFKKNASLYPFISYKKCRFSVPPEKTMQLREFIAIFITKPWLFDSQILQVLTNGSHVRSMVEVPLVALVALMPSQRVAGHKLDIGRWESWVILVSPND